MVSQEKRLGFLRRRDMVPEEKGIWFPRRMGYGS